MIIEKMDNAKNLDDNISDKHDNLSKLYSKPKATSDIWKYFGLSKDDRGLLDNENVVCRLCRVVVQTKDGNTTNLHKHLKVKHPDKFVKAEKRPADPATSSKFFQLFA